MRTTASPTLDLADVRLRPVDAALLDPVANQPGDNGGYGILGGFGSRPGRNQSVSQWAAEAATKPVKKRAAKK